MSAGAVGPPGPIRAVISDFGGVLTSPLLEAFTAYQEQSGVPMEALGTAMAAIAERDGAHPLFELECGRISEEAFQRGLSAQLTAQLGRPVDMRSLGEHYFSHLRPNVPFIEYMRSLRGRGYRMAICTNNVREWESRWRAMLPVDAIFHAVVDSGWVGMRKPDPRIYELTLERLGVTAEAAVFVDDVEVNCRAARDLGLTAVHFRATEQAIEEVEAALASG